MCGQIGTFDPFWDDLGSLMSKTLIIDREQLSIRICSKKVVYIAFSTTRICNDFPFNK